MNFHKALWDSICYIATKNKISRSGLAIKCGLDATSFNRSKQQSVQGQPRWLSTETLSKILITTNTTPKEFAEIFQSFLDEQQKNN